MPEPLNHIAFLSQEIGPRPAATEEEQQAALYITEQFQKEAGLPAVIEDLSSGTNENLPGMLCSLFTFVFTILALFFPVMAIPALLVAIIAALLLLAEAKGRPILSKMFKRGASQNVVAKYEPAYSSETGGARRRKIVVVANYDSGKVRRELHGPLLGILPVVQKVTFGAMFFVPIFLLVRYLFFLYAEGTVAITLNVITGIALFFVAIPIVMAIVHKASSYNEAANCNASGVAALLEIARRIGEGAGSTGWSDARDDGVSIYGEDEARAQDLVPEGARLVYEASQVKDPEPVLQTEEERLMSAKAAIAAMTGQPVSQQATVSVAENLVQVKEGPVEDRGAKEIAELREETREAFATLPPETLQEAQEHAHQADVRNQDLRTQESSSGDFSQRAGGVGHQIQEEDGTEVSGKQGVSDGSTLSQEALEKEGEPASYNESAPSESTVPDWFKKAQENAKKTKEDKPTSIQRSRYADALDAAVAESSSHFSEANRVVNTETEERLRKMRDGIMEVSAPHRARGPLGAPHSSGDADRREDQRAPGSGDKALAHNEISAAPAADKGDSDNAVLRSDQRDQGTVDRVTFDQAPIDQQEALSRDDKLGRTTAFDPIDVASLHSSDTTNHEVRLVDDTFDARIENEGLAGEAVSESTTTISEIDAFREEDLPSRRPIVLPDIGVSATNLAPIDTSKQQRAPLAMSEETSSQDTAKSLLNMLPSIDLSLDTNEASAATGSAQADSEKKETSDIRSGLRSTLPSLSGALTANDNVKDFSEEVPATGTVSNAGSFVSAGATGTFSPVGEELLQNVDPDDIYVDDADDSAYDGSVTETGAFAGPGYVDMPKSRFRRFFDKFGSGKEKDETSTQDWLNVDDDFDAQSAGAARGGWGSFREEYEDDYDEDEQESFDEDEHEGDYDEDDYVEEEFSFDNSPHNRQRGVQDDDEWEGGAFSNDRTDAFDEDEDEELDANYALPEDSSIPAQSDEMEQIYRFHNPDFNTEIWFVALGSELANNEGIKSFLNTHEQDLKGSIIVNLEALASGELCYLEKEGFWGKARATSRMKRYISKASRGSGVEISSASIRWKESAVTVAASKGFQAMSIVGMDGAKPSHYAQGDDVLENIDEETLQTNIEFVMELLRNI